MPFVHLLFALLVDIYSLLAAGFFFPLGSLRQVFSRRSSRVGKKARREKNRLQTLFNF